MKKVGKIIISLFILGLVTIMFFTNPSEVDIYQKVKDKEGGFSSVAVSKRMNLLLFSIYRVDILSRKRSHKSYIYIGVIGQGVELGAAE